MLLLFSSAAEEFKVLVNIIKQVFGGTRNRRNIKRQIYRKGAVTSPRGGAKAWKLRDEELHDRLQGHFWVGDWCQSLDRPRRYLLGHALASAEPLDCLVASCSEGSVEVAWVTTSPDAGMANAVTACSTMLTKHLSAHASGTLGAPRCRPMTSHSGATLILGPAQTFSLARTAL